VNTKNNNKGEIMPDEVVDTTEAPAESVEPTEPTGEEQPQVEAEEAAPVFVTADELKAALDGQTASTQSWLGRRDKETLGHIGTMMDERLKQQQEQASPDELSSKLLENPREFIREETRRFQTEEYNQNTKHVNTTMETVGGLMESDPLYTDKDLGNEVVAEIKELVNSGKINTKVAPAEAGKLILGDALSNVVRKRQGAKTNPLSANTPGNTGSSLTPAASTPKKKANTPKLDEYTQRMVDKWGYNEEDIQRIFGE
jgi:hypothetical protein